MHHLNVYMQWCEDDPLYISNPPYRASEDSMDPFTPWHRVLARKYSQSGKKLTLPFWASLS